MRVFVTVGATTPFDLLVEAVLSDSVRLALLEKGYDQLVVQVGPSERFHKLHEKRGDLTIQLWKLKPSLKNDLEVSDLVISHAGSGSILDALRLHKPLIAVPNPTLLHNHQRELAESLEQRGYLATSSVSDLACTISKFNPEKVLRFPEFDGSKFRLLLDEEMGFET
ncbi:glycosyltransferase family 1 protein [Gautieria morchelliformis]|nr:glycosyltransferase family 1 protein [Gautieria morchelliformis]